MKRPIIATALLATGLFGVGITVGQIGGIPGSSAATTIVTPTTRQPTTSLASSSFPAHGTPAHENAEKAVMGSAASQAQAAAVKYVGSGTAGPVTTDFQGSGYEVTVTKSDGSTVEVHLDSSFNVNAGRGGNGGDGGSAPGI